MSATQPLVCSAWYTPPLPSGAVATSLLDFINIAPASEKHGKSPCWKNVTDAASRPSTLRHAIRLRLGVRERRGHDVQGHGDRRRGARRRRRVPLQPREPLALQPEERAPARKADVVHALGGGRPEPRALPSREQNHRELAVRRGSQAGLGPRLGHLGVRRVIVRSHGLDRALGRGPGGVIRHRSRKHALHPRGVDARQLREKRRALLRRARVPVREHVRLVRGRERGADRFLRRHAGRAGARGE